jgi:hypothetical protein
MNGSNLITTCQNCGKDVKISSEDFHKYLCFLHTPQKFELHCPYCDIKLDNHGFYSQKNLSEKEDELIYQDFHLWSVILIILAIVCSCVCHAILNVWYIGLILSVAFIIKVYTLCAFISILNRIRTELKDIRNILNKSVNHN